MSVPTFRGALLPIPPTTREIAEDITDRIRGGEYPPGTKLPPAREVAGLYGVSMATAQRVMLILKERGVVVGRQGDAVYVAEQPGQRPGFGAASR
jgi:GntR family transcriptional regulator